MFLTYECLGDDGQTTVDVVVFPDVEDHVRRFDDTDPIPQRQGVILPRVYNLGFTV